jgi:hypothetical protein
MQAVRCVMEPSGKEHAAGQLLLNRHFTSSPLNECKTPVFAIKQGRPFLDSRTTL